MRDFSAIGLVPAMADAGVASLKIEGRLKGPDYVYTVSRLYREATEAWLAGHPFDPKAANDRLRDVFSRGLVADPLKGDYSDHSRVRRYQPEVGLEPDATVVSAHRQEEVEWSSQRPAKPFELATASAMQSVRTQVVFWWWQLIKAMHQTTGRCGCASTSVDHTFQLASHLSATAINSAARVRQIRPWQPYRAAQRTGWTCDSLDGGRPTRTAGAGASGGCRRASDRARERTARTTSTISSHSMKRLWQKQSAHSQEAGAIANHS